MRILVENTYEALSIAAAQITAEQIRSRPDSVLGLATGSTPIGMYQELVTMHKRREVDFSAVQTFNLDEYVGLASEHPQSYHFYMQQHLFRAINIKPENIHIPDGMAGGGAEYCRQYDEAIEAAGGIDLQLLGIGHNGHIGFNEPACFFSAGTQKVRLALATLEANRRFFTQDEQVPEYAISMGIRNIMMARKILLLANGQEKAAVIKAALTGPITPQLPASVLQLHRDITVILTVEAASKLMV